MTTVINGSSPSITFSDSTTQATAGLTTANPVISSGVLTFADASTQASSVSSIGLGGSTQGWTNVTASRALSTTYTNSTGRPIFVSYTVYSNCNFYVNGSVVGTPVSTTGVPVITIIVPNGATYQITDGSLRGNGWWELR